MQHMRWIAPTVLLLCSTNAIAESEKPLVPKTGACPGGWHASGAYCQPNSNDARAIEPKVGACPSGWYASGSYCVANSEKSKPIVPKQGTCPTGWHAAGAWCQRTKAVSDSPKRDDDNMTR